MLSLSRKQNKIVGGGLTENESLEEMNQEPSNDSDRMVSDQISHTLEIISKIIESNLDATDDPFFSNKSLKMDTTMNSDVDLLPDMERMDIEESSFLKNNSFLNGPKLDTSGNDQLL